MRMVSSTQMAHDFSIVAQHRAYNAPNRAYRTTITHKDACTSVAPDGPKNASSAQSTHTIKAQPVKTPVKKGTSLSVSTRHTPHRGLMTVLIGVLLVSSMSTGGCGERWRRWKDRKKPVPKAQISRPTISRDIPSSLRGTIGAEAQIKGVQQTLVSGIGFVVGLNGTGGLTIPEQYAAHLEREMGMNGVTVANDHANSKIAGMSPRDLLRDRNTAAVIVQAAIPAGARAGETYDVYVRAINATSLEGGRLWTTEMRIGPPSAFGSPQARILGKSRGPIFLNPFAEPGGQFDGITRDVGRVLDGGTVTFPTQIEIILDNPSHQRARQIVSAINSAFPEVRGDGGPAARGKDETLIQVQIPKRYIKRRKDFIDLISHITIDQSYPEIYARRYARTLMDNPYLAGDMSWCLEALGERAIPFLNDLYDYPDAGPRLAALRAGAALGDVRVVKYLREMALDVNSSFRTDAMSLMSTIDESLLVDTTLRELLEAPELSVRVEAYEDLMDRATRARRARIAEMFDFDPGRNGNAANQLDILSRVSVPNDPIRGVGRTLVEGKFFLDIVPYGDPLIYVTQQHEPRIVLFGENLSLHKPLLASAWSDRFMLAADDANSPIRMYYRDEINQTSFTMADVPERLPDLIRLLAHDPTPENPLPGLSMSYSQVVGVLYHIYNDRGVLAAFTTEEDRLLADLLSSIKTEEITMRPESPNTEEILVPVDDPRAPIVGPNEGIKRTRRTLLVPVTPVVSPGDSEASDQPESNPQTSGRKE
jgi:Flagellar P-ring protein